MDNCLNCYKPIKQKEKQRPKKYCSNSCKMRAFYKRKAAEKESNPKFIESVNITGVSLTKEGIGLEYEDLVFKDKELLRKPTIKRPANLKGLPLKAWEKEQKEKGFNII